MVLKDLEKKKYDFFFLDLFIFGFQIIFSTKFVRLLFFKRKGKVKKRKFSPLRKLFVLENIEKKID